MTTQHPDSDRIITSQDILLHDAETALLYEELRSIIDDGNEGTTHEGAMAKIVTLRTENAELKAQLAQRFDAADMATASAQGFRDGVASTAPPAAQAGGWISVDERLPEPDGPVLAHNGKWTGVAAWMSGEYLEPLERWQDEHREFIEMMGPAITHWMPLPHPPSSAQREVSQ